MNEGRFLEQVSTFTTERRAEVSSAIPFRIPAFRLPRSLCSKHRLTDAVMLSDVLLPFISLRSIPSKAANDEIPHSLVNDLYRNRCVFIPYVRRGLSAGQSGNKLNRNDLENSRPVFQTTYKATCLVFLIFVRHEEKILHQSGNQ